MVGLQPVKIPVEGVLKVEVVYILLQLQGGVVLFMTASWCIFWRNRW
jgi:hypothetical protein